MVKTLSLSLKKYFLLPIFLYDLDTIVFIGNTFEDILLRIFIGILIQTKS